MASIPATWHVLTTVRSRGRPDAAVVEHARINWGRGSMRFVSRVCALAVLTWPLAAVTAEMRGVTASEIRIGQTMPYSGPVSAFGALGKGEVGYFKMLN